MSKLEFKIADFHHEFDFMTSCKIREMANARLAEMLSECPVVYQTYGNGFFHFRDHKTGNETHTARVVNIEEIKPEVCEHELKVFTMQGPPHRPSGNCAKCGVKLEAKWEPVE